MSGTENIDKSWTIAYRNPRANSFHRVTNWAGTWREAKDMARKFVTLNPTLQVWYVTTAQADAAQAIDLAERLARGEIDQECVDTYLIDHGNVMVDSGKRIKIRDNGTLSAELLPTPVEIKRWSEIQPGDILTVKKGSFGRPYRARVIDVDVLPSDNAIVTMERLRMDGTRSTLRHGRGRSVGLPYGQRREYLFASDVTKVERAA